MNLTATRLTVHTKHPFRIARPHSSVDGQCVRRVIVRFDHDGVTGFGEAAPTAYYNQSLESVERTIADIGNQPEFLGEDPFAVVPIMRRLLSAFADQRAALAAVDAALHDWIARHLGVPVFRLFGLDPSTTPPTSMTIGIDDPETIKRKVREAATFGILKCKVGTDHDVETITLIRRLAPDKRIRADANGAWPADEALERIKTLTRFDLEMIEQPIAAGQPDALRELHKKSPIPLFIDEDCIHSGDVPALAGAVTGINIKLAKCGGIREALRMIELARALDLQVMLGCMVETSLGISAAAQLASLVDYVDLDGHLLLADDPFDALELDVDRVIPKKKSGLAANGHGLDW